MQILLIASKPDALSRRARIARLALPFLACLALSASPVLADSETGSLTLNAALQSAIAQNPSLKIFSYRHASLDGNLKTANLKPALELGADTENFAGTGEANGFEGVELTVALSSVIEMGNKRSVRVDTVSSARAVLDAQRQVEALALLGEVTRRYVEVLAGQEQSALADEAFALARHTLDTVKKRAIAGATPEAEVKRAVAAAAQARLALLSGRQQLESLKVSLSALWGDTAPPFSRVEGDLFHFGADVGFEQLYAKVLANPAVEVFAAEERLKEAEVRLAKTQSRADINWSLGVRSLQESSDTALVAGVSMPLFSAQRNVGAVTTAMAERDTINAEKDIALVELHTQLFRAFYSRQQAIVATEELRTTIIPALEQALNQTEQAYQQGRYGYLEYVSARQELLSARQTLIDNAATALTLGAEIEQLTAEPLSQSTFADTIEFPGSDQ